MEASVPLSSEDYQRETWMKTRVRHGISACELVGGRTRFLLTEISSYKARSPEAQAPRAGAPSQANAWSSLCDHWRDQVIQIGRSYLHATFHALTTTQIRDLLPSKCDRAQGKYDNDCKILTEVIAQDLDTGDSPPATSLATVVLGIQDCAALPAANSESVGLRHSDAIHLRTLSQQWLSDWKELKEATEAFSRSDTSLGVEALQNYTEKYARYRGTVKELAENVPDLRDPEELSAWTNGELNTVHHVVELYFTLDPRGIPYLPPNDASDSLPFWHKDTAWDPWLTDDLKPKFERITEARQLIRKIFDASGSSPASSRGHFPAADTASLTWSMTCYDGKLDALRGGLEDHDRLRQIFIKSIVDGYDVYPGAFVAIPSDMLFEAQIARTNLQRYLHMPDSQIAPDLASLCSIDIAELGQPWAIPDAGKS